MAVSVAPLHGAIRNKLDPRAQFLSDDDIRRIMLMFSGIETSVVRQCLLGLLYAAQAKKDAATIVQARKWLSMHEHGQFNIWE